MSSKLGKLQAKNQCRVEIQDRVAKRISELCPSGASQNRVKRHNRRQKQKQVAVGVVAVPSAPYAPTAVPCLDGTATTSASYAKRVVKGDCASLADEGETSGDEEGFGVEEENSRSVGRGLSCCGFTGIFVASFLGAFAAVVLAY